MQKIAQKATKWVPIYLQSPPDCIKKPFFVAGPFLSLSKKFVFVIVKKNFWNQNKFFFVIVKKILFWSLSKK